MWNILLSFLFAVSVQAKSEIPDSLFKRSEKQVSLTEKIRSTFNFGFDATIIGFGAIGGAVGVGAGLTTLGMRTLFDQSLSSVANEQSKNLVLKEAIRSEINTIRKTWKEQGEEFQRDPLISKLAVTEKLIEAMTDPRFKDDVQHQMPYNIAILKEHRESLQNLAERYRSVATELPENDLKLNNFAGQLKALDGSISALGSHMEGIEKDLIAGRAVSEKELESVRTELEKLNTQFESHRYTEVEGKAVSDYLFKESLRISTESFKGSKKIRELESELVKLGQDGNKLAVFKKSQELKDAIHLEQQKRIEFDRKLDNMGSAVDLLAIGLALGGNKKLAHQVSVVGHAAITITKGVGALLGVGTAAAMSGPLAPLVAIGGAILSVLGLFSGPSPEEVILEQIQKLQEQVNEVRKEMHERFEHVEKMLIEHNKMMNVRFDRLEGILTQIHENMHLRFDRLEALLDAFHREVIAEFLAVRCDTQSLLALSRRIDSKLIRIESKMDQGMRALYSQEYVTKRDQALGFHTRGEAVDMPVVDQKKYFAFFENFAANYSSHFFYTGVSKGNQQDLLDCVTEHPWEFCLGIFTNVVQPYGVKVPSDLPNPTIWAKGVETLLEFVYRTPELKVMSNHLQGIAKAEGPGKRFIDFVRELRSNTEALLKVFDGYRQALKRFQKNVLDRYVESEPVAKALVASATPKGVQVAAKQLRKKLDELDEQVTGKAKEASDFLLERLSKISEQKPDANSMSDWIEYYLLLHIPESDYTDHSFLLAKKVDEESSEEYEALSQLDQHHALMIFYVNVAFQRELESVTAISALTHDLTTGHKLRETIKALEKDRNRGIYFVIKSGLLNVDKLEEALGESAYEHPEGTYSVIERAMGDLAIFKAAYTADKIVYEMRDEL